MFLRNAALAAVALVVTQASGQSSNDREREALQQRVDALAQQLHLRYGVSPNALERRRDSVQAVLGAWNQATRGAAEGREPLTTNLGLMSEWLDDALASAMPGGSGKIPPAPIFVDPPLVLETPREVVTPPKRGVAEGAVAIASPAAPIEQTPRAIADSPRASRRPASQPVRARKPASATLVDDTVRQPSFLAQPTPAPRRTVSKPVVPPDSPAAPLPTEQRAARSKWSRHPAAAPLKWRDPFDDDPEASPNPLRQGVQRRSLRPTFTEAASVRVNVTALAAEIRGYNTAYRELQRELQELADADRQGLVAFIRRFELLQQRGDFIELYVAGTPAPERRGLPVIASQNLLREFVRREAESLRRGTKIQRLAAARLLASIDAVAARK